MREYGARVKELYCNTDIKKWRQIKYLLKFTRSALLLEIVRVCVCVCVCVIEMARKYSDSIHEEAMVRLCFVCADLIKGKPYGAELVKIQRIQQILS